MSQADLQANQQWMLNHRHVLVQTLENELGFDLSQTNLDEIVGYLDHSGQCFTDYEHFAAAVASRIAVHETHFLRHHEQFAWLETFWLQEIISQTKEKNRTVRILSAGCATGEEPYSLFAHLQPLLEVHGIQLEVDAVDVNQDVIDIAKKGRYGLWSLRGVDHEKESNWLEVRSRTVRVREWVQEGVHFSRHNLTQPFNAFLHHHYDLVLCRNVMIYMRKEAIEKIYGNLFSVLQPDGYLVPGPSDPSPEQVPWLLHWENGVRLYRKTPQNKAELPEIQESYLKAEVAENPVKQKTVVDIRSASQNKINNKRYESHAPEHIAKVIKDCRYDEARQMLEENIANNPMDVRSYVTYSVLAMDLNELKLAQANLRKAFYLRPDAPYVVYLGAIIKQRVNNREGEIKDLQWLKLELEKFPGYQQVEFCEEMSIDELKGVLHARLAAMRRK